MTEKISIDDTLSSFIPSTSALIIFPIGFLDVWLLNKICSRVLRLISTNKDNFDYFNCGYLCLIILLEGCEDRYLNTYTKADSRNFIRYPTHMILVIYLEKHRQKPERNTTVKGEYLSSVIKY